jgi:hypothetical protein
MAIAAARRLEKVETSLTPTQLVLRWLHEAHSHRSLVAYVQAVLGAEEGPLDRLAREARASARAGPRHGTRAETGDAVRRALQATVFRFELVMRINVRTQEFIDREALVNAVITAHLALAAGQPADERMAPAYSERLTRLRDLALGRVVELHAASTSRSIAEDRYLDGHPALFPDGLEAWSAQVTETERLAVMADRLVELHGLEPNLDDEAAVAASVPEFVADFVEPAKATALEKLGEGERARRIAKTWLRGRATPAAWAAAGTGAYDADGRLDPGPGRSGPPHS